MVILKKRVTLIIVMNRNSHSNKNHNNTKTADHLPACSAWSFCNSNTRWHQRFCSFA